jgi:hypothetical protein
VLEPFKQALAEVTNPDHQAGSVHEVLRGADVFIGVRRRTAGTCSGWPGERGSSFRQRSAMRQAGRRSGPHVAAVYGHRTPYTDEDPAPAGMRRRSSPIRLPMMHRCPTRRGSGQLSGGRALGPSDGGAGETGVSYSFGVSSRMMHDGQAG